MAADAVLSFDDGQVTLGGTLLPGILVSQSVRGQVRFDQAARDGMSGKAKTPLGWEDAEISLVVALTSDAEGDDCYDKLARLDKVFRGRDSQANPQVCQVSNRHLLARGVSQVVFAGLESSETEDDDVILATLAFVEHNPPIVKQEARVTASATSGSTPAATATEPSLAVDVIGGGA